MANTQSTARARSRKDFPLFLHTNGRCAIKVRRRLDYLGTDQNGGLKRWLDEKKVRELVRNGFFARTRADSGTVESRLNDTRHREKAFASRAHFIGTDDHDTHDRSVI